MIIIHHVGPSPESNGGMAAVIESYLMMSATGFAMRALPTWEPGSRVRATVLTLRSLRRVLSMNAEANIVHLHLSERGSFIREGLFAIVCRVRGTPVVATLHGANFTEFSRKYSTLVRIVLSSISHVMTLGPDHREVVEKIAPNVPVSTILNPVDVPSDVLPYQAKEDQIVFAGEVGRRKGFDRLLAAWSRASKNGWAVLACGPKGDINPSEAEYDRFEYLGNLKRAEARSLIARAKVVCLPSRAEVLPMTILEAVAAGTHVVATRVGEYKSLLECPNISWITERESESTAELVAAFERLTVGSDMTQESTAGIMWIRQHASITAVQSQLEEVYQRVVR